MDKEIWIVRHGETEYNRRGIIQGQGIDSHLNRAGYEQADLFYKEYSKESFDHLYLSTLIRTEQTMTGFIKKGLPYSKWSEIDEINWGIHEGQPAEKWMIESYNKLISSWRNGNLAAAIEQGESGESLWNRVHQFINRLKNESGKKLLVCSHGRTIRCMMAIINGKAPAHMEHYKHSNTGLYVVRFRNGSFETLLENDCRHLSRMVI